MRTYVLFDPITNQAYKEPGEEVCQFVTRRHAAKRLAQFEDQGYWRIHEWFEVLDSLGKPHVYMKPVREGQYWKMPKYQ